MNAYADLVVAVKPCVHSVADHCLSVGLLSEEAYNTIIQRHDLIDTHKARILLSNIRDAISQKPECLRHLITVLHNVRGCEGIVHRLEDIYIPLKVHVYATTAYILFFNIFSGFFR